MILPSPFIGRSKNVVGLIMTQVGRRTSLKSDILIIEDGPSKVSPSHVFCIHLSQSVSLSQEPEKGLGVKWTIILTLHPEYKYGRTVYFFPLLFSSKVFLGEIPKPSPYIATWSKRPPNSSNDTIKNFELVLCTLPNNVFSGLYPSCLPADGRCP